MYCIQCGVKLSPSEEKCPLCGTVPYHPDIPREKGPGLYPTNHYPGAEVKPKVAQAVVLMLFLLPFVTTLLIDLRLNSAVTWSGYVMGGLTLAYVVLALPGWFRNPNPVVFVPCGFATAIGYLLYIDLATGGNWFMSFAFPVAGGVGLIVTAVVTLLRYVRRGWLYILGGGFIAFGAMMLLMEFLIVLTFARSFVGWSVYPLAAFVLLGGFLIFLGINDRVREIMERKMFI